MADFTQLELKELRTAMQSALEAAGPDGMTMHVGNCSYSGGEATFKVKVTKAGALSREAQMLALYAGEYDLDPTRIGTINGQDVTLQGYNSKATKMPWMVSSLTSNSKWKLTQVQAKVMFGKIAEAV